MDIYPPHQRERVREAVQKARATAALRETFGNYSTEESRARIAREIEAENDELRRLLGANGMMRLLGRRGGKRKSRKHRGRSRRSRRSRRV